MLVKMSNLVGGDGGREFTSYLHTNGESIKAIHISAGDFIDGFQIVFETAIGQPDALPRVGGDGGRHFEFPLDEDEHLVSVTGRAGDFIDQIQFHTNKKSSAVYGGPGGEPFTLSAADGEEIAGFFGRSGWFIDSLGIATRPIAPPAPTVTETVTAALGYVQEMVSDAKETIEQVVREAKPKDLQKIEGIGPKISHILVENGIPDLAVLAETQVDKLKDILKDAGSRYKLADPSTWPEQAKVGVDEGMKALKAFQSQLKGGRRK